MDKRIATAYQPVELRRIGRELSGPKLDRALAELWSGDRNQRRKALFLAGTVRHTFPLTVLFDATPCEQIQILSPVNVARLSAETLIELVADAPMAVRTRLYKSIREHAHLPTADTLISPVRRQWGDREAARILPSCSPEIVGEYAPELGHAVTSWGLIAIRHAEPYLDELERQFAELPRVLHQHLWHRHSSALRALAHRFPHRLLDLLERYGPTTFLPDFFQRSRALVRADPHRYARLLVRPSRWAWLRRAQLGRRALKILADADPPELVDLARQWNLAAVLKAVAPAQRAEFYDSVTALSGPRIDFPNTDPTFALLPHWRRHEVARDKVEFFRQAGDENARLEMTAYLPFEQAHDELHTATRRGDAEERQQGYRLLIDCAARTRQPARVNEVLAEIARRVRNERDPVRCAVLRAITTINPRLLTSPETLDTLTRDAVRARDNSLATSHALSDLAESILVIRGHVLTEQAVRTLATLLTDVRHIRHSLDVPAQAKRALWETVRSYVDNQSERGDFTPLLRLTTAFAQQAWDIPELQQRLHITIKKGAAHDAERAIRHWLADPRHRGERVAEILRIDGSSIALAPVEHAVLTRCPDLFRTAFRTRTSGKFQVRGGTFTSPRTEIDRLSPQDQQHQTHQLERLVTDEGRAIERRSRAIVVLARIPGNRARIEKHTWSDNIALAEAALHALARTDEPERALPTLFAHMNSDRAHAAMSAAVHCARFARPSELATLLRESLSMEKVASRKQIVRMATQLPIQSIMDFVLPVTGPDQHRDVQAACGSVALHALDDPRAWTLLQDSLGCERELARPALQLGPLVFAERHRADYAKLIASALDSPDERVRQWAIQLARDWSFWSPAIPRGLAAAVTDLATPRVLRWPASNALTRLVRSGEYQDELTKVVEVLARATHDEPTDAAAHQDRPARQRLNSIVRDLGKWAEQDRVAARDFLLRIADVLLPHRTLLPLVTALRGVHTVRLDTTENAVRDLSALATLYDDRPVLAAKTATRLASIPEHNMEPESLLPALRQLSQRGVLAEGFFAVTLCQAVGKRLEWPESWRALLRELRGHPEIEVADSARAFFTAPE